MLDIAKTIWEVGKGVFGVRGELQKARRDRRDRVAAYFGELAALVESVSAALRVNRYPHGSCAQLQTLAQLMSKTLKGLVDEQEAHGYQVKLLRVREIEQLFGQLQALPPKKAEAKLAELDAAAGYFRARAAHLRVA